MEKKETMEGRGCTREKPLQAHYSTGWTLARALQGWPGQEKSAHTSAFLALLMMG
jgi:hypothetical protein